MSDQKFLLARPGIHRNFEKTPQLDFDVRYRQPGGMTRTADKNIRNGACGGKSQQRLDIGRIIQHMQQLLPQMAGVIRIYAGKQIKSRQIDNTDKNQRQYKRQFDAAKNLHLEKKPCIG